MLASISLKNFKSFKNLDKLELKPLTILVGKNSSGKSSIIQSLLLLKQSASYKPNSRPLEIYGDYVHYSELSELIYGRPRRNSGSVSISIGYDDDISGDKYSVGFTFVERKQKNLRQGSNIHLNQYRIEDIDKDLTFDFNNNFKPDMLECPESLVPDILGNGMNRDMTLPVSLGLTGLRPSFVYYFNETVTPEMAKDASYLRFVDVDENVYPFGIGIAAAEILSSISYLGPLRADPQRIYTYQSNPQESLDSKGSNAAYIYWRDKNTSVDHGYTPMRLSEAVDYYMNMLGVTLIDKVDNISRLFYSIKFKIGKGKACVPISDVGFGVSQVLPIILRASLSQPKSLTIFEQPEIHLHPNCQARLADLFVDMINNDKQVLVETHSVDLINKLRLLVLRNPELREMINVYFIDQEDDNGNMCSVAKKLTLDMNGSFDEYPQGFCDESINLMQTIMRESYLKKKGQVEK